MKRRVVITGYGVMTAFGFGEQAVAEHILRGKHGFRPVRRFDGAPYRSSIAAESDYDGSLLQLGIECTGEALGMSGLRGPLNGSVLIGTNGDYDAIQQFWQGRLHDRKSMLPLKASVPGYHAEAIAAEYRIQGRRIAFTNACVASSNAIGYGYDRIAQGQDELAVCGGYFLVNEEFTAKFNSGRALSRDGLVRPFSADRSGLLLGDGGAMFVLESLEHALQRGAVPLAELAGWGLACDAYHVCQPHPEGSGMAMAVKRALHRADLQPSAIDYVNAHGTATPINDPAETKGIKEAFGSAVQGLPISSSKSMTGHILEGTGAVETAICLVAMRRGIIPPTASYSSRDPACDLDYVPNEPRTARLQTVMNLNAGFGGNNCALILKGITSA
ncbi:beta-ketoacyl-[acyl-carrier-protein] synthase family protein [Paenibacillus oenotherae]|uniref:Nodulation protein E n=1 Tax=Paenibacillus oenotherae TaxID=1435645 RepID=A0ABS7DBI2_9BACL|nr:beta-ketoacyl-[acyl-carrier-protein] synthase family protein [Paenibacillus oenotherae]MBW7477304.1 beta-ketoacyl-[acyl-carrier-protein] synthase family protein [Paenibacillus oenotherae]